MMNFVALALLVAVGLTGGTAHHPPLFASELPVPKAPPLRCSLIPFPGVRLDPLHLVGTALPDTVLVGPGPIQPSGGSGHYGSGQPRPVYGQRVQVEMLHFDAPESMGPTVGEHQTIIVVPWDYNAECQPAYWNRSAAWVEPGVEGFYSLRLRPEEGWVDGIPVADAIRAPLMPYPVGTFFRGVFTATAGLREAIADGTALTPREYFTLYAILPTDSELRGGSVEALQRLASWEAANPSVASRYPAVHILENLRRQFGRVRLGP